jgi:hypothetical protein
MVDERVGIAVILAITFGYFALGNRLGLLRADSRRWRTFLFFTVYGVVLVVTIDLLEFGLADVPMPLLFLALPGALGGGLSGLLMSYLERRWPS